MNTSLFHVHILIRHARLWCAMRREHYVFFDYVRFYIWMRREENEWHPINALLAIDLICMCVAVGLFHAANSRHAYVITVLNNSPRVVINHIHLFHQVKQKSTVRNVRRSVQARSCGWLTNISTRPAFNAPNAASHWQLAASSPRIPSTIA